MARKTKRTSKKKQTGRGEQAPVPPLGPQAMEQMLGDITRLLQEQEFASPEEANAFLQQYLQGGQPIPRMSAETPLQQAQELIYEAWNATGRKRITLAKKALKISPDCADAYVLLAEEEAGSVEEAYKLYEQGVAAGERALGPEAFTKYLGHFWGVTETRPYMRARLGLAELTWMLGKHNEAVAHLQEMLRLNPGDNQGVRYLLASLLLQLERHQELAHLLAEYEGDIAAHWSYTAALLAFRQHGRSRQADDHLRQAITQNRHVPAYLLGEKLIPSDLPGYRGIGDESEAIDYILNNALIWRDTPGAIDWMVSIYGQPDKKQSGRFKVGDSVAMKAGMYLEEQDISGWQGYIMDIDSDGDLEIMWDSQTMRQIPDDLIKRGITKREIWSGLTVPPDSVRPVKPRDKPEDAEAIIIERYADHGIDLLTLMQDEDLDDLSAMDDEATSFDLEEWFDLLEVPQKEKKLLRQAMRKGLNEYAKTMGLRRRFMRAPLEEVEVELGSSFTFGFAALEILQHPQVSGETKLKTAQYALANPQTTLGSGVPYGVFTLLGYLAAENALPIPILALALITLRASHAMVSFFGRLPWMEGATKEALVALADWLAVQEELTDDEKLWLVEQITVNSEPHHSLGKALANHWLAHSDVPADYKLQLCQGWLDRKVVGIAPEAIQMMDAVLRGDREKVEKLVEEKGLDPSTIPPLVEMPPILFLEEYLFTPPYLQRLAIPTLVRLGKDLHTTLDLYWESDLSRYDDSIHAGIADTIAEFHEQLSAAELREWIERGINHSRGTTRKPFFQLSTRFYGDQYLQQALQDNTAAIRKWATKQPRAS